MFGYYYLEPDQLALGAGLRARPVEIVAEALDAEGSEPRRDYGWLRLASAAPARFEPVPLHVAAPALVSGAAVATIGSPTACR